MPIGASESVLINNVWNEAWAEGKPHSQCLRRRITDAGEQYGWTWSWPEYKPYSSYAAPEALFGWKAWDGGPSTTAQLPRRIGALACPCGGRLRLIALILEREVAQSILHIDIAAYAPREKMAAIANNYFPGGCATSYAAPTALGAALDFADHFSMTYSSLIDDPGILHVAMLLMGDRKQETGSPLQSGFSNLWGAGRMRMRRWDEEGLDGPWGFGIGSVCVDDGQTVIIPMNGGAAMNADVNVIKAASYWYDRSHETGKALDDIALKLRASGLGMIVTDIGRTDEKRRVYLENAESRMYELILQGPTVTSDDAGCGTNSMLVYYAYIFEDSDRDDSEGPPASVLPE